MENKEMFEGVNEDSLEEPKGLDVRPIDDEIVKDVLENRIRVVFPEIKHGSQDDIRSIDDETSVWNDVWLEIRDLPDELPQEIDDEIFSAADNEIFIKAVDENYPIIGSADKIAKTIRRTMKLKNEQFEKAVDDKIAKLKKHIMQQEASILDKKIEMLEELKKAFL